MKNLFLLRIIFVIHTFVCDDVIVADIFGKVKDSTFVGDNLGNSIYTKPGTGMVIDGDIRDLDGIYELPDFATLQVINQDSEIHGGTPVFTGTRVPVKALIDHLKTGESLDYFLEGFPSVSREQAITFLELAFTETIQSRPQ